MSDFSTAVSIILLTSVSRACPLCRTPLSDALLIVMSQFFKVVFAGHPYLMYLCHVRGFLSLSSSGGHRFLEHLCHV